MEGPLCSSCGHHHEQGVKCHICGHVGKSQIFAKMRSKADERRQLKVQTFALLSSTLSQNFPSMSAEMLQAVIEHFTYSQSQEQDIDSIGAEDMTINLIQYASNHTLLFAGDLLVGSLSFDIHPVYSECGVPSTSNFSLVIKNLTVHSSYRHRTHCWYLLHHLLQQLHALGGLIQSMSVVCTAESWIETRLQAVGFVFDQEMSTSITQLSSTMPSTGSTVNSPATLSVYSIDLAPYQCSVGSILEFTAKKVRQTAP